jgi:hypothetical protein
MARSWQCRSDRDTPSDCCKAKLEEPIRYSTYKSASNLVIGVETYFVHLRNLDTQSRQGI